VNAAIQAANAVAKLRLQAVAELVAAGCPIDCIGWWQSHTSRNCGLTVCGNLACEICVEWDEAGDPEKGPELWADLHWCGDTGRACAVDGCINQARYHCGNAPEMCTEHRSGCCEQIITAKSWVPDKHVQAYWAQQSPRPAYAGPTL